MQRFNSSAAAGRTLRPVTFRFHGLLIAAALLTVACVGCVVPQPRGAGKLERLTEPTTKRAYWLYLPKPYQEADAAARAQRRWPLVVTFHGMKPFDNAQPQALEWESEADRYGFIIVAPELRAPDVLAQFPVRSVHPAFQGDEAATLAILDHVFATTDADPGSVLSTSWSSGGYMAHYMLNRHPDRFTCLAVRQSNFSAAILSPEMVRRSQFHPVLILNTQNDFAICKEESKEAVDWYTRHDYKNIAWVHIKDKGHERTPDLAADFFARVSDVKPSSPPKVLVQRQAIDGNPAGRAFLEGKLASFRSPTLAARSPARFPPKRPSAPTPPRPQASQSAPPKAIVSATPGPAAPTPLRSGGPEGLLVRSLPNSSPVAYSPPTARRTSAVPGRSEPARSVLGIRLSSAIGIEPLLLGYSAECPSDWLEAADFLWTLDGVPVGNGVNGQKTIFDAGEHTLALLIVTGNGEEHRVQRTVRVLPRLTSASSGGSP